MGETTQTRSIPALSVRAAVVPSSIDVERRTVELTWTTGARVMRGFFDRFWEELSTEAEHVRMGRLQSGRAPLLASHNSYSLRSVLGVVEEANIKPGEGRARVRFATAAVNEEADRVFRGIQEGVIGNVSVGYRVHRYEKGDRGDDDIQVYRAVDWEPYEISMVPMGADADAGVRSEGQETNPCQFVFRELQEHSMDEDKTPGAQAAPGHKDEQRAPIDEDAVRKDAADKEMARITGIQDIGRKLGLGEEFVRTHVSRKTTLAEFRAHAIDEHERAREPIVSDAGRVAAIPGGDERDKWLRGAGDWLIQRSAVGAQVVEASKMRGDAVKIDPGEFRGLSFIDLARQALERAGVRTAGMDKRSIIGEALTMRGSGGYAATGDFPVLLENTLHKVLLASYGVTADTWSMFCMTGSVSDFRAHNRYRLGSFGTLQTVNEHGEFQNQAIPDGEKETISVATKGNIIGITRQALINDDMSAFSRLATMLGRAARLSIESDVYALLALNSGLGPAMADGDTLFHNNHDNIGTGSALGVSALDADRVKMAEQLDPSGNEYLDLRPAILLVPVGLGGDARVINDAQFDIDAVDSGTDEQNKFMRPNKVRGLFRDIVDTPRLSGTRRYLFADPSIAPVIEVAFLDGMQEPYMEMQDGWRVDGVEWKIRLDYGVGAIDYRGAVTNAGA